MNGDLLYVWNAPTYVIKFYISSCFSTTLQSTLRKTIYAYEFMEITVTFNPNDNSLQRYCFFPNYTTLHLLIKNKRREMYILHNSLLLCGPTRA